MLIVQLVLPQLHDMGITAATATAPSSGPRSASAHDALLHLDTRTNQHPGHDRADCPVCQVLAQVQHFLAPPLYAPLAITEVSRRDAGSTAPGSVTVARAASPRAPPRFA